MFANLIVSQKECDWYKGYVKTFTIAQPSTSWYAAGRTDTQPNERERATVEFKRAGARRNAIVRAASELERAVSER